MSRTTRSKQTETWPLVLGPGKPNPALHLHSNNTSPVVYWCPAGHRVKGRGNKAKAESEEDCREQKQTET